MLIVDFRALRALLRPRRTLKSILCYNWTAVRKDSDTTGQI